MVRKAQESGMRDFCSNVPYPRIMKDEAARQLAKKEYFSLGLIMFMTSFR